MISRSTIEAVKNLPIEDVVGQYVQLKKNKALSPFTDEKTPSFSVSPRKNIWKCFSSGKAGDGIQFVMEHKKLTFREAVEEIARDHQIEIGYEEENEQKREEREEQRQKAEALRIVLSFASAHYMSNEVPEPWWKFHKFRPETLEKFQIGYASENWDDFYNTAIRAQYRYELLLDSGLIKRSEKGKMYDAYRDRIIFPICDRRGEVIAFTARIARDISNQEKEQAKAEGKHVPPKYVNSPDEIWQKGDNLYGLHLAERAIRDAGFCFLVEGTTDVMQFHEKGLENVVAPCGTALTDKQIKLLKRYAGEVCIVPDVDDAGLKALDRSARLMLEAGLHVKVLLPEPGEDPDSHLKRMEKEEVEGWLEEKRDYLAGYLTNKMMTQAGDGPREKAEAIRELGETVELIQDPILRASYYDAIGSDWKDFRKCYKLQKRDDKTDPVDIEDENERSEYFDYGFFEKDGCYYTKQRGTDFRICPFTMQYLYYVHTDDIPVYVVKFRNSFGREQIKALSADQLSMVSEFKRVLGRFYGRYIFDGSEQHLNAINYKLRGGVKQAHQPDKLGFFPKRGFYVWGNGILEGGQLYTPDQFGVVRMRYPISSIEQFQEVQSETVIEVQGKDVFMDSPEKLMKKLTKEKLKILIDREEVYLLEYYYLPYADKKGLAIDNSDYTEHKRFKLILNDKVDFERWSSQFVSVYNGNSYILIAHYIMSLYTDVIFKANKNYVPLLDLFGPPQTGKSTAAASLMRMFGADHGDTDGVILTNATLSGMNETIDLFRNSLLWFNELRRENKNDTQKMEFLKGLSGSSSRVVRKTKAFANRNEKCESATVISGQDSATIDTGLNDRCVILKFEGKHRNAEAYDVLKHWESEGLCTQVTAELLGYRSFIEAYYAKTARELKGQVMKDLEQAIRMQGLPKITDDRMILNAVSHLAPVKILLDHTRLVFPFAYEELYQAVMGNLVEKVKTKAVSDEVAQFFSVLSVSGIQPGVHYKIQREGDNVVKLFLRLRPMMGLYRQACSRQGMYPFQETDIKDMLLQHRSAQNTGEDERYQLGYRASNVSFEEAKLKNTSAIVLNYDLLRSEGIELPWNEFIEELETTDDQPPLNPQTKRAIFNYFMERDWVNQSTKTAYEGFPSKSSMDYSTFRAYMQQILSEINQEGGQRVFMEGDMIRQEVF